MEIYSTKVSKELINKCKDINFYLFDESILQTMLDEDNTCFIAQEGNEIICIFTFYPIDNGELIVLYDFPYKEYDLKEDDLTSEFNYIGAIEMNPLYKNQGYGKKIVQWIKENNPDNKSILIKSVNNSIGFWKKQGFNVIATTYFREFEYWMLFSE